MAEEDNEGKEERPSQDTSLIQETSMYLSTYAYNAWALGLRYIDFQRGGDTFRVAVMRINRN